jgi:hypothetical protein
MYDKLNDADKEWIKSASIEDLRDELRRINLHRSETVYAEALREEISRRREQS